LFVALGAVLAAQQPGPVTPAALRNSPAMPALPQVFDTAVQKIRVSAVAAGLVNPWSVAFLPNGDMLVTERAGRLRIIRNGVLDPTPIAGTPTPHVAALAGLLEIAVHPRFAENRVVYLTYSKGRAEDKRSTTALARATFDGKALVGLKDIFVANTWSVSNTNYGGRIAFDRAGFLYLTVGERQEQDRAQKPEEHAGKVLRLRDDGTTPPDNPFAGKPGYLPRSTPPATAARRGSPQSDTGELWENEHGPLGGDELNILKPGANYGWPLVTYGTDYDGTKISDLTTRPDLESPFMYWVPSIAISASPSIRATAFPQWKGNVFVGSMFAAARAPPAISCASRSTKGGRSSASRSLAEAEQAHPRLMPPGARRLLFVLTD
jgi:glucose/arabinose dehydrogenase